METVSALKLRSNLGEVLEKLNKTGEPILVSKGKNIKAVMITPEQFEKRFFDKLNSERQDEFLKKLEGMREKATRCEDSLEVLRQIRGYNN